METEYICYSRKGLEAILPHRGKALRKIDGALYNSVVPRTMVGVKEVNSDDPDLDGHFPGAPTYPGYAQDEFVCLIAAALIPHIDNNHTYEPHVVQKSVRYKKNVVPGDRLKAEVRLLGKKGRFYVFSAEIRNQHNELVAEYEKIVGAV